MIKRRAYANVEKTGTTFVIVVIDCLGRRFRFHRALVYKKKNDEINAVNVLF